MTNHNDKEDIGRMARMSGLDTEVDGMLYVVSFSKTLYSHCFSRLCCEMSRWGQPREGCSVL